MAVPCLTCKGHGEIDGQCVWCAFPVMECVCEYSNCKEDNNGTS
jgi:hypothetical protein